MDKKMGLVGGLFAIVVVHFSVVGLLSIIQLGRYPWIGVATILAGVIGGGLVLAHSHDRVRPNGVRGAILILVAFVIAVAPWDIFTPPGGLGFTKLFAIILVGPPLAVVGGIVLAHAVPPTHGTWWQQLPYRLLLPLGAVLPIATYTVFVMEIGAWSLIPVQIPLGFALVCGLVDWVWAGLERG